MMDQIYYELKTGNQYTLESKNLTYKSGQVTANGLILLIANFYARGDNELRYIAITPEIFENEFASENDCPFDMLVMEKNGKNDEIVPIKQVLAEIENGTFDDGDGYAFYATNKKHSFIEVNFEDLINGKYRPEFTHVFICGK